MNVEEIFQILVEYKNDTYLEFCKAKLKGIIDTVKSNNFKNQLLLAYITSQIGAYDIATSIASLEQILSTPLPYDNPVYQYFDRMFIENYHQTRQDSLTGLDRNVMFDEVIVKCEETLGRFPEMSAEFTQLYNIRKTIEVLILVLRLIHPVYDKKHDMPDYMKLSMLLQNLNFNAVNFLIKYAAGNIINSTQLNLALTLILILNEVHFTSENNFNKIDRKDEFMEATIAIMQPEYLPEEVVHNIIFMKNYIFGIGKFLDKQNTFNMLLIRNIGYFIDLEHKIRINELIGINMTEVRKQLISSHAILVNFFGCTKTIDECIAFAQRIPRKFNVSYSADFIFDSNGIIPYNLGFARHPLFDDAGKTTASLKFPTNEVYSILQPQTVPSREQIYADDILFNKLKTFNSSLKKSDLNKAGIKLKDSTGSSQDVISNTFMAMMKTLKPPVYANVQQHQHFFSYQSTTSLMKIWNTMNGGRYMKHTLEATPLERTFNTICYSKLCNWLLRVRTVEPISDGEAIGMSMAILLPIIQQAIESQKGTILAWLRANPQDKNNVTSINVTDRTASYILPSPPRTVPPTLPIDITSIIDAISDEYLVRTAYPYSGQQIVIGIKGSIVALYTVGRVPPDLDTIVEIVPLFEEIPLTLSNIIDAITSLKTVEDVRAIKHGHGNAYTTETLIYAHSMLEYLPTRLTMNGTTYYVGANNYTTKLTEMLSLADEQFLPYFREKDGNFVLNGNLTLGINTQLVQQDVFKFIVNAKKYFKYKNKYSKLKDTNYKILNKVEINNIIQQKLSKISTLNILKEIDNMKMKYIKYKNKYNEIN